MTTTLLALVAIGMAPAPDTVPIFEGLGNHSHPITTHSQRTQEYFDQGFKLVYGFNHAEAIRSFEAALHSDPDCAMCYWGIAFAAGPNINAAMDEASGALALEAIENAKARSRHASEKERAYISALSNRYGPAPMANRASRDSAYARAMQKVSSDFPDDSDAQVL